MELPKAFDTINHKLLIAKYMHKVSVKMSEKYRLAVSSTFSKGQILISLLVCRSYFFRKLLRVQYLAQCHSMSTSIIYFFA